MQLVYTIIQNVTWILVLQPNKITPDTRAYVLHHHAGFTNIHIHLR